MDDLFYTICQCGKKTTGSNHSATLQLVRRNTKGEIVFATCSHGTEIVNLVTKNENILNGLNNEQNTRIRRNHITRNQ